MKLTAARGVSGRRAALAIAAAALVAVVAAGGPHWRDARAIATPTVFTVAQSPVSAANVQPGAAVSYTINVTPSAPATNLVIKGSLVAGLQFASTPFSPGGTYAGVCSTSGQSFNCSLGAAGTVAIAPLTVNAVAGNVADATVITQPAGSFAVQDGQFDGTPATAPAGNFSALTVQNASVLVSTTGTAGPISSGGQASYNVTLTNNGSLSTGPFNASLTFSGGTVFNIQCPPGTASFTGNTTSVATCSGIPSLSASGGTAGITVTATAAASATPSTMTATSSLSTGVLTAAGSTFTVSTSVNGTGNTAVKLGFTTQPGGAAAGTALAAQPAVAVQDSTGLTVSSDNTTQVTLAANGGPGVLSCSAGNTRVVTGGVASFSGCSVSQPGNYTLQATSSPAFTPATSTSVTIGALPAAKLGFVTAVSAAVVNVAFSPAPQVAVQDANGATITSDNSTVVTLGVGPGSPGAIVCGSYSRTVVGGVATFAGCSVNASGASYTLRATSNPIYTQADSPSFSAGNFGPAAKLGFTAKPATGQAGTPFSTQFVVAVQDANGLTVGTDAGTQITLSVMSGGGTLTCNGGLTASTSAGVATFSGCKVTASGVYAIRATSSPVFTYADSGSITVASGAAKLGFTTQPAAGVAGTVLPAQPVVAIQDASGATVTADSTTVVTLQLVGGPQGATLTCSGTGTGGLSVTAVAGVATFTGCAVSQAATGYTIVANSSPTLTNATSNAFDVTPAPPVASAQIVVAAPAAGTFVPRSRLTFSATTGTLSPAPAALTFVIQRASDTKYWDASNHTWGTAIVQNSATAASAAGTWTLAVSGPDARQFVNSTVTVSAYATAGSTAYVSSVTPTIVIR